MIKNKTDQIGLTEHFFLSKGFEIFSKHMDPDNPDSLWSVCYWLRLGRNKYAGDIIEIKKGGGCDRWNIKRDHPGLLNCPMFEGYIDTQEQFLTLWNMFDIRILDRYRFKELENALIPGEEVIIGIAKDRFDNGMVKNWDEDHYLVENINYRDITFVKKSDTSIRLLLNEQMMGDLYWNQLNFRIDLIEQYHDRYKKIPDNYTNEMHFNHVQ